MSTKERLAAYSVYQDDDGRINDWNAEPMTPSGQSLEELIEELNRFHRALPLLVFDYETAGPRSSKLPEPDA